jgi:phosphoenolpyruvate synthase/pyruvate phosphate dikinase
MTEEFTLPFSKISKKDTKIAGGKGASLGEMARAGFSVPPGFVVLASAFEKFLAETDINVEIEAMWNRKVRNYSGVDSQRKNT